MKLHFKLYNTTHTYTLCIYNVRTPHISIECIQIALKKQTEYLPHMKLHVMLLF